MSAPTGRARPPARPLLYLGAADAVVFLIAELANLLPLVQLGGPTPSVLTASGAVLIAAAVCGFLAGWLGGGEHPSTSWLVGVALVNPLGIGAVAAYFAVGFRIFGDLGFAFIVLAVPGLIGAALLRANPIPE